MNDEKETFFIILIALIAVVVIFPWIFIGISVYWDWVFSFLR